MNTKIINIFPKDCGSFAELHRVLRKEALEEDLPPIDDRSIESWNNLDIFDETMYDLKDRYQDYIKVVFHDCSSVRANLSSGMEQKEQAVEQQMFDFVLGSLRNAKIAYELENE